MLPELGDFGSELMTQLKSEKYQNVAIARNGTREFAQSQKLDAKKWPQKMRMSDLRGHRSLFTYAEELEYLKNWLNTRIKWLNSEWHN